jgi:phosphoglycerate dehydrogenase-like enzyme
MCAPPPQATKAQVTRVTDVLYVVQQQNVEPWLADFLDVARSHDLPVSVLDHDAPQAPQFAGISVVVDQGGHASPEMIDVGAAAGVRLWQVLGTGLDHTEVAHIHKRGLLLANTPGQFSAIALAEHALMLILALAKRLREAEANAHAGIMYHPVADELGGQTLGLVGLGASGSELARRAHALGMKVRGVDVAPVSPERLAEIGVEHFDGLEGLDDLLRESDYVSLHVPLTSDTRHLIDQRRLALFKPTASLINVARGRIVDEDALAQALADRSFAGAGLDVFGEEPLTSANPLLALDNVVATPHTAGVTRGTSRRRSTACVENALRVLNGEQPLYLVHPES